MSAAPKLNQAGISNEGPSLPRCPRERTLGPARSHTTSQNTAWWMVVLGDLLTLLVCFSVAIIVSTQAKKESDINTLITSTLPQSVQPEPGTKLALGDGSAVPTTPGEWFHMSETAVSDGSFMALDEWLRTLRGTEQLMVEVLTCGRASETRYQMELVARVQGALTSAQALRFSEVGIGCEELRARAPADMPEAAVLVRLIRKSHG